MLRNTTILACTLLVAACSSSSTPLPVAEFSLQDVNPNSTTTGQNISPRDYLTRVSAWYFGSAT